MSIEQIIASKLAGEAQGHEHWFVMCGACKEVYCPLCEDRLVYSHTGISYNPNCPRCGALINFSDIQKSLATAERHNSTADNPYIWNEHKLLKHTKGHGKLLKRGRELRKSWKYEDDPNWLNEWYEDDDDR